MNEGKVHTWPTLIETIKAQPLFQTRKRPWKTNKLLPDVENVFFEDSCCILEPLASDELYSVLDKLSSEILKHCNNESSFFSWIRGKFPQWQAELIISDCRHRCSSSLNSVIRVFLEYVLYEILKLISLFIEHSRSAMKRTISVHDVRIALHADVVLKDLLLMDSCRFPENVSIDTSSLSVDELICNFVLKEQLFRLDLELLLHVFAKTHSHSLPLVLQELIDLSLALTDGISPDAFINKLEHLVYGGDFDVFLQYSKIKESISVDSDDLNVRYLFFSLLDGPIFHFCDYVAFTNALLKVSNTAKCAKWANTLEDIHRFFIIRCACMRITRIKAPIYTSIHFFGPGIRPSDSTLILDLQSRFESWSDKHLNQCCFYVIKHGNVMNYSVSKERWNRSYCMLFDTKCLIARPLGNAPHRLTLKSSFSLSNIEITDYPNTLEYKDCFKIACSPTEFYIFSADNPKEKSEWLSAFLFAKNRKRILKEFNNYQNKLFKNIPLLLPHESYRFSVPDTPENIVYEANKNGVYEELKGATFEKFLEKVTYHDGSFRLLQVFLVCYRNFCTPLKLLELLIDRFNISEPVISKDVPPHQLEPALKKYRTEFVHPIQLRVLNVMKHWIDNFFFASEKDVRDVLLASLLKFITEIETTAALQVICAQLKQNIQRKLNNEETEINLYTWTSPPPPFEFFVASSVEQYNVLTLHPIEIARQMTLIESKYFRALGADELLRKNWQRPNRDTLAPTISKMTKFWNTISFWVRKTILETDNVDERSAIICRFIDIAQVCLSLNNFSGLFAVASGGLGFSAVYNLHLTWSKVPKSYKQTLAEFDKFYDNGHYRPYLKLLHSVEPPCVPFLPDYLTKALKIEDGNPDFLDYNSDFPVLINIGKQRKIVSLLSDLGVYQNTPYNLAVHTEIQDYLLSLDPLGDKSVNEFEEYLYKRREMIDLKSVEDAPCEVPKFCWKSPGVRPLCFQNLQKQIFELDGILKNDNISSFKRMIEETT